MNLNVIVKSETHNDDGRNASGKIVHIKNKANGMDNARLLLDKIQEEIGDNCDECYSGKVLMAWYDSSDGNSYTLIELKEAGD